MVVFTVGVLASCSVSKRLDRVRNGDARVEISIAEDQPAEEEDEKDCVVEEIDTASADGPIIMNAIRDEATGEMVATDVIKAAKVVARFRHVAERLGKVALEFDIVVPSEMTDSKWQLRFAPKMIKFADTTSLSRLFITGSRYRASQLRGYQRYEAFLRSIITDTTDFVYIRQLELFLERHFPDTYAMKSDTSLISEPEAESYFGVTQREALEHYTKHYLVNRNNRRRSNIDRMFRKYVKSPFEEENLRLDTVLTDDAGDVIYRYTQLTESLPGLRKIIINLSGEVREEGRVLCELPPPEDLVFYVSSLSTLADNTPHYRMKVIERTAYDNTLALIDFAVASSKVDTTLSSNGPELRRIKKVIRDIEADSEFIIDSVVVSASCSPEGAYSYNAALAERRTRAIRDYFDELRDSEELHSVCRSVPENWDYFDVLVRNDSFLSEGEKDELLDLVESVRDPDRRERMMSKLPSYRYLREKVYPRLRTVRFGFHLRRPGMVKDTVHTTELDTVYMRGLEALADLDYRTAATLLRPYEDYNAALALAASSYNLTALDILSRLGVKAPKVLYLEAVIKARLGDEREAARLYLKAVELEPSMRYRANLDPELSELAKKYNQF
ncbi:MAG: hypothetical protein MJY56_03205 [Bacteroidales bacterium]|nr:hypothetical protein [Bacteroidales bacterium]